MMDEKKVTSVVSYLQVIGDVLKNGVVAYRGHGNKEKWELKPSIGRVKNYNLRKEKAIFLEFKSKYYLYTNDRPTTNMDLLFLAQHYGLPTRLLDWTYNPLVALWFACLEGGDVDGCVYVKKISDSKENLREGHDMDDDIFDEGDNVKGNQFISPDDTNIRFLNQKGAFLWFKDPTITCKSDREFVVDKGHKSDILKELTILGNDEAFVYPDLEHLCKSIKSNYEFE